MEVIRVFKRLLVIERRLRIGDVCQHCPMIFWNSCRLCRTLALDVVGTNGG
jgi:hypothetical protein